MSKYGVFSGLYFPKTPYLDTFHAVKYIFKKLWKDQKWATNFKKQEMVLIDLITINKETLVCPLHKKKITKQYANLVIKDVTNNKNFWKSIKPCFIDKSKTFEKIVLIENEEIATEDYG